ncbi:MAG: TonB-dependent receptor, partial [candidate division Zixibacteria bacterium]|nr:TonB-dependent receptor [candidate division Zixibacteria bacterium]
MRKELLTLLLFPLALILLMIPSRLDAGVSGKISGQVIDAESGEPIVGATIRIAEVNLGTMTDEEGDYFIINMPIGKHDVSVSSVGFEGIVKKDVRVLVGLTTPVDFTMQSEVVELDQNITVYASNPIIQQDLTESKVIFTSDRLENLPNIVTVQSVLTNYPGVVVGREEQLHVRGGRSGQVAYYFDGFSVQDPFYNTMGFRVMPSALEELSLSSGGYTAEYGDALSGVVSAVTKDGGPKYHGNMRVYEGATSCYDVNTGDWGSLEQAGNRSLSFNLSGPVPGASAMRLTFFTAGEFLKDETSLPVNGTDAYTWTAKIAAQPLHNLTVKTNVTVYDASGGVYTHRDVNGISYDFNLDGSTAFEKKAYLVGLRSNYNFSENMILSASINRFRTYTKQAPSHLMDVYWTEWPGYSEDADGIYDGTIDDDNYLGYRDFNDPTQTIGFTEGDDFCPLFRMREAIYNSGKLSLLNQLNKIHQIKGGVEIRRYDISWDSK